MATVLEVLEAARERYAEAPSHAESWDVPAPGTHCMVTAIYPDGSRRVGDPIGQLAELALVRAVNERGTFALVEWNATHTTEEVLAAFDRAIETERERCHIPDGRVLALA